MKQVDSHTVSIYVAGDIDVAKQFLRQWCYDYGLCVTIDKTNFIYTGGEEQGIRIGLVHYPRFPRESPSEIESQAIEIATAIIPKLCQRSALVVGPTKTTWITIETKSDCLK